MPQPKLSIITINLNNRDGLRRTAESVISQTFRDLEWIVIDGGSTDGSRELIEQYSDHITYWVSEPDHGIYNAMNKGIKVAKGEYLQFLNSGDYLREPSTLNKVFSTSPIGDILYGDCAVKLPDDEMQEIHYGDTFTFKTLIDGSINHQSTFIRRGILENNPYDETLKIVSDRKFFIQQALARKKFVHIPLTIAVIDTNGISSTNDELLQLEDDRITAEEVPECILEMNNTIEQMKETLEAWQVKKTRELSGKRPLFHKMITANIKIMQFIDKIL